MKKLLAALCITSALLFAAHAADEGKTKKAEGKRPEANAEMKALKKEMLDKYDANKDGKLDKDERDKMSEADKGKVKEARKAAAKKAE